MKNNKNLAKEGIEFIKDIYEAMSQIQSSKVGEMTKEQSAELDERHRKMCTGEWDGPETPYVKFIKDFYKNRDWSKYENKN
jgi:hypothetical protein